MGWIRWSGFAKKWQQNSDENNSADRHHSVRTRERDDLIVHAVQRTVREYGETLQKLADE